MPGFKVFLTHEQKQQWHPWFAWHPVKIDGKRVQWKKVWRRGTYWYSGGSMGESRYSWRYEEMMKQVKCPICNKAFASVGPPDLPIPPCRKCEQRRRELKKSPQKQRKLMISCPTNT